MNGLNIEQIEEQKDERQTYEIHEIKNEESKDQKIDNKLTNSLSVAVLKLSNSIKKNFS